MSRKQATNRYDCKWQAFAPVHYIVSQLLKILWALAVHAVIEGLFAEEIKCIIVLQWFEFESAPHLYNPTLDNLIDSLAIAALVASSTKTEPIFETARITASMSAEQSYYVPVFQA
uniref:Uncharacterized protein n=1 Tax=Oryza meridionalis TaxID=40149 RepID=A0A0E0F3V7_9ORYZ